MKKKKIAMLLVVLLSASLIACGNSSETSESEEEVVQEETEEVEEAAEEEESDSGYEDVDCISVDTGSATFEYEKYELTEGDSGQQAIIVYFNFANTSGEDKYAYDEFGMDLTLYQNGIQLSPLLTTMDNDAIDNADVSILEGASLEVAFLYELQDTEGNVLIRLDNTDSYDAEVEYQQQQEIAIK